jgi:hypothetical protein
MLVSIGSRLNFSWTGSCAIVIEAIPMMPSATGTKMNLLAFIIVDLLPSSK